jgi:hypothetical protein
MAIDPRRGAPGSEVKSSFRVGWLDDFVLEVIFDGNVDGALIASLDKAIREKFIGRTKPWAMLFVGEKIEKISADVRAPAIEMLSFIKAQKPVVTVGATPNIAARMFGGTLGFAVGFKLEVVDSRVEGMKKIEAARRAVK